MKVGILTLNRFNGQEQFAVADAIISLYEKDGNLDLNFEIETDKKPLKTLPDTETLYAEPNAEFTVRVTDFDWNDLVGKRFVIPYGYDEKMGEYLTRFCYCEHEDTDDNVIEIIERGDDKYRVVIKATCTDVCYYDGSKPRTEIEIDAWFRMRWL